MRERALLQRLLRTGGACAVLFLALRAWAEATVAPQPIVTVSGACPALAAIEGALSTILPARAPGGPVATARVSDLGAAYLVVVGDRAKEYPDTGRDCAERARVVAAFIALALSPAAESAPSVAPATIETAVAPPAATPAAPSTPTTRWLRADAQGVLGIAPQGGLTAPGASLRVAAGWKAFGAHARCGWFAATSMSLPGQSASVLLERFPCALGPTLHLLAVGRRLEVQVDPGIALGALRTTGRGFATTLSDARFEVGAHLSVDAALRLGASRGGLAPVLGVDVAYYPLGYELDVSPRGAIAHTPNLWAGITAGVCWTIE